MSAELALSIMSLVLSVGTMGIILALLSRSELDYASRRDLRKLNDHLTDELGRLQYSQSQLWRYAEAVDDHTGGNGHRVLSEPVPGDHAKA